MTVGSWLFRGLWLAGGLALVLGAFRPDFVKSTPVQKLRGAEANWATGSFAAGAAYPFTTPDPLPPGLATLGSWIEGDAWQGKSVTAWFPCKVARIRIMVAGYPHHAGCKLSLEFRFSDTRAEQIDCRIADPRETWCPWDVDVPKNAVSIRVLAEDSSKDLGGWLAYSEPIAAPSRAFAASYMVAQVFATLALAIVLLWGPGLLWLRSSELRLVGVIALGPLTVATIGIVVWAVGAMPAGKLSLILIVGLWSAIGWSLWRSPKPFLESGDGLARALAISVLLSGAAVAKSTHSRGPEGELYGGTTHRSLAVGDRSDSRIPFYVVQAAAHRYGPASADAERFFTPWTFFSRGPLAGLIALPVTLATGGMPPKDSLLRAWQPYDPAGFAACRIVQIVLASSVVVAFFAAVCVVGGQRLALAATAVLALTPFVIHETMFTWPKLVCTAWILNSFYLAHVRRSYLAGLALGIGFLFHPMAALWLPWVGIWAAVQTTARLRWLGAIRLGIAALAVMLPWMLAGKIAPHDPQSWRAGQGGFFDYFALAEYERNPPISKWWKTRWANFSNTSIPFWLHLVNRDHPVLNSFSGPSGALVKFEFGWWNTLPLGAGLVLWVTALSSILRTLKRNWLATVLFLALPGLLLTFYWGASSTGLMRECGHPLLPALVGIAVIAASSCGFRSLLLHPMFPWLQLPEAFLMIWLTTCANHWQSGMDFATWDPFLAAANIAALCAIPAVVRHSPTAEATAEKNITESVIRTQI